MSRRRTNDEILSGLVCSIPEAARVLRMRKSHVVKLIDQRRLHAFASGAQTKVGIPSLKALATGAVEK